MSATSLFTQTSDAGQPTSGTGAQATYRYDTRRMLFAPQVEHYDRNFQSDTAFYNRTGFTSGFLYSEVNFYPEAAKRVGLIRVHPLVVTRYGHDDIQMGDEGFLTLGVAFNFNRQGYFRVQTGRGHEPWGGQRFRTDDPIGAFGNTQIFSWLRVGGNFFYKTWATFYDPVAPFQGRSTNGGLEVTWQPTVHFSQFVGWDAVRFSRADTGERVFTVDIVNAKSIYQFNTKFFVRLLEQFDSSRQQLLTDLLASYEFIPGTVVHAGYGSLYEQRQYQDGRFITGGGQYQTVNRGLFLKASYLYRF